MYIVGNSERVTSQGCLENLINVDYLFSTGNFLANIRMQYMLYHVRLSTHRYFLRVLTFLTEYCKSASLNLVEVGLVAYKFRSLINSLVLPHM